MSHSNNEADAMRQRRRRVLGRLFVRAARVFQEEAVQRIHAAGYAEFKLADNAVLVHLEEGGNRISELARRSGITKQGISKLVHDLERRGWVTKVPDPTDGRAQLVQYTEEGQRMLHGAVTVVEALDAEMIELVGAERGEQMRETLMELLEKLDEQGF